MVLLERLEMDMCSPAIRERRFFTPPREMQRPHALAFTSADILPPADGLPEKLQNISPSLRSFPLFSPSTTTTPQTTKSHYTEPHLQHPSQHHFVVTMPQAIVGH